MNSACNYLYLLADYNNDKTRDILVSEEHVFGGGRGCVLDYFNVYDEGKFLLITTGVEEQYFYGGNTHNDYQISCEGGTQEIVTMDDTNYLLTKSQHGIDALHKVFTRADGLNDVEEVCKFAVKYKYE
jgi:hypothetical protein